MSTCDQLSKSIQNKEFLGFYLFRNISMDIQELSDYFNDSLETYFLSEKEKRILAKLVFALKSYEKLLEQGAFLSFISKESNKIVIDTHNTNPFNAKGSYILADSCGESKAIVNAGGVFSDKYIDKLLNIYTIVNNGSTVFANNIIHISSIVNEWIRNSGDYFIFNIKQLDTNN